MTVQDIIENTKEQLKKATGAKVVFLRYNLAYDEGLSKESGMPLMINAVVNVYGVSWENIKGKSRTRGFCEARQMFIYLALERLNMTLGGVAKILSCDHSSVIYHRDTLKDYISIQDPQVMNKLNLINEYLK